MQAVPTSSPWSLLYSMQIQIGCGHILASKDQKGATHLKEEEGVIKKLLQAWEKDSFPTYSAGHACIFQARCSKCGITFSIPSSSCFVDSNRWKFWTLTVGAVLGQMATGGRAYHLQQVMASIEQRYIPDELQIQLAESVIVAIEEGWSFPAITEPQTQL